MLIILCFNTIICFCISNEVVDPPCVVGPPRSYFTLIIGVDRKGRVPVPHPGYHY